MTTRAQELLREALALPIDERAAVAAELLASLEEAGTEKRRGRRSGVGGGD